jgi:hypothetical protein
VSSLTNFFESDFNTQRDQWEKALLNELKLTEIGTKATKKMLSGATWPTLSLKTKSEVQLPSSEWKKASLTYGRLNEDEIEVELTEDLKSGVRNFFFHAEALNDTKWKKIEKVLKTESDVEVFILGGKYQSSEIKVISNIISGQTFHDQGAHSIQELALLTKNLIDNLNQSDDFYLGVFVDSHFFHNIAKIRAAKLLAHKVLSEAKLHKKIKIVALTSYAGWTLFERYSNMLRNETAVASAYIGGADHIQSSGYNTLLELETEAVAKHDEHVERSRRMARNTSHVLALESMLGIVEDAAFGSYHLESLTQALCEDAWKLMQTLLTGVDITSEITKVREQRLQMVKTRKTIMSGMNDYPDVKEQLKVTLTTPKLFRVARPFEELRLKMENMKKPEVCVALYGDYGALNARLNFVKNYFELLGLTVHENFDMDLSKRKEEIIVLCALDDQYPNLTEAVNTIKTPHKYIAGKFEMPGFQNLFAGQNVFEVLEHIVQAFEGRKS